MTDKLLPDLIPPEGLQVAEAYLAMHGDTKAVAQHLGLSVEVVDARLRDREVKGYIDRIYNETGFRNRHKLDAVMDHLINSKIDEMQETGLGSSKDIAELIQMQHRMNMDRLKAEADLYKAKAAGGPTTQTNVQNNINIPGGEDENYAKLLQALSKGK